MKLRADHSRADLTEGDVKGIRGQTGDRRRSAEAFNDVSGRWICFTLGKTLVFTYNKKAMASTGEHFHVVKYQKLYDVILRLKNRTSFAFALVAIIDFVSLLRTG